MRPSERQPKVTLRFPEAMHRRLTEVAQAERRSLNNLILLILEDYLRTLDKPDKGKS